MVTSAYFPRLSRQSSPTKSSRGRLTLPVYSGSDSSSAVQEKRALRMYHAPRWIPMSIPIPFARTRRIRLVLPNPIRLHTYCATRFGPRRGLLFLLIGLLSFVFVILGIVRRCVWQEKSWVIPFIGEQPTLVFKREELQRIWQWEIESGHYPSRRPISEQIRMRNRIPNPALPPRGTSLHPQEGLFKTTTQGTGPRRIYLDIQSQPPDTAYPPRPVPGSVADLDVVMEHCDFSQDKFVRDCLEVLRVGAGLDNGKRMRRGKMDDWKYIYVELPENNTNTYERSQFELNHEATIYDKKNPDAGLVRKHRADWEAPLHLPPPLGHKAHALLETACDTDNPRIFHMFWTGPFTDKPYLAILSFLYTQNTGLHLSTYPADGACRPQFWLWINPGPAASVPNPSALGDMMKGLESNPWSAPFLHPRFRNIIQFKLWNTTEQLDGIPELRDEWRSKKIFNSGGVTYEVPPVKNGSAQSDKGGEDLLNRTGSKSSSTYDRLSVVLSDMARFILCHRFGGVYLDADTIFLRDWEELWGWKGAFAYRWSRLPRYNTAVLRMNRGSALGSFLFRTALNNGFDFHPMTVSRYTRDAYAEELLLRLPDALFDSAWLSVEDYQRSRPPQPFFTSFEQFFDSPPMESAAPQALGFEGFFRGAYSYHFHNFWWKPFDPVRNWPDLGPRFEAGERQAKRALRDSEGKEFTVQDTEEEDVYDDRRDLDWATVLKRTFEAYIRGEQPNMYGEWLEW